MNEEVKARYPLNQLRDAFVAFQDGAEFEGPLSRPDVWTVRRDENDGSA